MFFGLNDVAFLAAVGRPPAVSDSDAEDYLQAVETADGNFLEVAVRTAVNDFVVGCKADGIWNAIKASCILAGARTLTGALVPLVGAAPTNVDFVSGDYDRKTGLVGDGSTKYLDTNRNNNADPQNSNHNAVYATSISTGPLLNIEDLGSTGANALATTVLRNRSVTTTVYTALAGLVGHSRSSSISFTYQTGGITQSLSQASEPPQNSGLLVFRSTSTSFGSHRIAFYSIGESLDLALLDARVTALINAFDAAI
jgi:hypothetical protein